MIDIQTLKQTIYTSLGTSPFTISGEELHSPPITRIFTDFLGSDLIQLSDTLKHAESDTDITVTGQMNNSFLGLTALMAYMTFAVVEDKAHVLINLSGLPSGWKLSDSFVPLKNSMFDNFSYTNTELILDSQVRSDLPDVFPKPFGYPAYSNHLQSKMLKGLSLKATLSLESSLKGLEWFLIASNWTIEGPIVPTDEIPSVCLKSMPKDPLHLAGYHIPFYLNLVAAIIEPPDNSDKNNILTSCLQVEGDIKKEFKDKSNLDIPVYFREYASAMNVVLIHSDMSQASSLLTEHITELINGASIESQIPSKFPRLQNIQLESICLSVIPSQAKLISVGATVSFAKDDGWSLFGGILNFKGIWVTFTYFLDGIGTISTDVECKAEISGGMLDATISLPDLTYCCELEEGQSIDITAMVHKVIGESLSMPQINVESFKVFGDIKNHEFRFQAAVTNDWTFKIGKEPFGLTEIDMDLTHIFGDNSSTSGEIVGIFTLAEKQLFVMAGYDSTSAGWHFQGGTVGEQDIDLTNLTNDVLSYFNWNLPANTPHLLLKNINLSFNTASHDFSFLCATHLELLDVKIDVGVEVSITHTQSDSSDKVFKGYLWIGDNEFEIDFLATDQSKVITASWKANDEKSYLEVENLLTFLGFPQPNIPKNLDLALKSASLSYDFTNKEFILTADSANYGKAVFAAARVDGKNKFFFGILFGKSLSLSDIPIVGESLSKVGHVGVDKIEVHINSKDISKDTASKVNPLIPDDYPQVPAQGTSSVLGLSSDFTFGKESVTLSIGMGGDSDEGDTGGDESTPTAGREEQNALTTIRSTKDNGNKSTQADGTHWFNLQKSFGPITFQRVGVDYENETLWFLLDASLSISGLKLDMMGAGFGSPLTKFAPKFKLHGLGIDYNNGAMEIGGALLIVDPPKDYLFQLDGDAVIRVEDFSLAAIGSYAQKKPEGEIKIGWPSMFLYADVGVGELGWAPYIVISNIMAGFGFNRSLKSPASDQVLEFPLLALGTQQSAKPPTPAEVLEELEKGEWIPPHVGDYWLAAGLGITCVELLRAKILIIGLFGEELALTMLGIASITLPPESEKIFAYAAMEIEGIWKPLEGFVGVSNVLDKSSYILDPHCHITGGFAFYLWYMGDNAGQFVLTWGGYHPHFKKPPCFPAIKQLGLNWAVSKYVVIKGGAYFALTPSCAMAGGDLEVLFQDGNLKAWFTAAANFLMAWKPFYFSADISVSIGVSYKIKSGFVNKTIKAELGASLEMWGPPTGGKAHVHLKIISFTIHFGSTDSPAQKDALNWNSFSKLLPEHESICKIQVHSGLVKKLKNLTQVESISKASASDNDKPEANDDMWVVRADNFTFSTETAIPSSTLHYGSDKTTPIQDVGKVNIRPMNKKSVESKHILKIYKDNDSTLIDISDWELKPVTRGIPEALWGKPLIDAKGDFVQNPQIPESNTVPDSQIGIRVSAPLPELGYSAGEIPMEKLAFEDITPNGKLPLSPATSPDSRYQASYKDDTIDLIKEIKNRKRNRDSIFDVICLATSCAVANGTLERLADSAGDIFADTPLQYNQAETSNEYLP